MIVLDASVIIGFLLPEDAQHDAAMELLRQSDSELLVNSVTLAEVLIAPTRENRVDAVLAELAELGVTEVGLAFDAARKLARLRMDTGLKMPDCCVLLTAMDRQATVATFDRRLSQAAAENGV